MLLSFDKRSHKTANMVKFKSLKNKTKLTLSSRFALIEKCHIYV